LTVAGTSRSGPQSWIDEQGRSLKAVEELLLAETYYITGAEQIFAPHSLGVALQELN